MYTVYLVTFPNNKKYVGFTEKGIVERKRTHYASINSKKRTPMKNALKKYKGRETWEVLNCYQTLKLALKMESIFIERYDSVITGYNVQTGGQYCPPTRIKKGNTVYDYQGNKFNSFVEAAEYYGVTSSMVSASCREGYVVKNKTIFRRANEDFIRTGIICLENGKYYFNTVDVCSDLGFTKESCNSISRVIRGERSSYKGYTFIKYEDNYKSLIGSRFKTIRPKVAHNKIKSIYSSEGIHFNSCKEASDYYKIPETNIFYSMKQNKTLENGLKFSQGSPKKSYKKQIFCKNTGQYFKNIKEASSYFNINYSFFSKYFKKGKSIKGYSFEYVTREVCYS